MSGTLPSDASSLSGYSFSNSFPPGESEASPSDVSTDGYTKSIMDSSHSSKSLTIVGAIAGGVFGGTLSLLLAFLLLSCYQRRARRARENTEDNASDPTTVTATTGGVAECMRSRFCRKPRENYELTPYLVTFSVLKRYNEKFRPVASRITASQSTLLHSIAVEEERQPSPSIRIDGGQSSNADVHNHSLSSTANTVDILNQMSAIHAAVLSLPDRCLSRQTMEADGTMPPPYSI